MAQGQKHCRTQDCLRDEEIIVDLYSDNLSDVPTIFSVIVNVKVTGNAKENAFQVTDSEKPLTRVMIVAIPGMRGQPSGQRKIKTPDLGQFTGNAGVKLFPSDPMNVSDVRDLFFGDIFFDFLCEETNLYYFENRENMTEIIRF
jgi:hypothetical protein